MSKNSKSLKQQKPVAEEPDEGRAAKPSTPAWKALLLATCSVLVFFVLLELALAVFGVQPTATTEDPFVGFAEYAPLFVPEAGPVDSQWMVRSDSKRNFFNQQRFLRVKRPDSYRIFTLGGSTTYGRPYNDTSSFSGWLREMLPDIDPARHWEVINAGGVSYASYRVANLMEELSQYQPDLFVIYTGHNEFLEERTYGQVREMSPLIKTTASLLARTRTWSAMKSGLQHFELTPEDAGSQRDKLSTDVNTILDRSAGLDRYTRDDRLQEKILRHFRISLERMIVMAQSADARVVLVSPAANLKDSSPFKSQHSEGLGHSGRQQVTSWLTNAQDALDRAAWQSALDLTDRAIALDPRNADAHYLRGRALLELGAFDTAKQAFLRASNEDVCPLRALTSLQDIVAQVAEEQNVPLVDYVDLVEDRTQQLTGHRIPGEELFLDHVHPTIEGHKLLAMSLVETMAGQGILQLPAGSLAGAVTKAEQAIDAKVDRVAHGQALANLARVIYWAGKLDDAERLARKALEKADDDRQVFVDASSIIASVSYRKKQFVVAVDEMYRVLERAPGAIEIRIKMGQILAEKPFLQFEKSAANMLLACQQMPYLDAPFATFGNVMLQRGRLDIAYLSLQEALRLNPKNGLAQKGLAQIRSIMGNASPQVTELTILLDLYPSRAPRKLVQVTHDRNGRQIPHGAEVVFYENGRLKRFTDIDMGKPSGLDMSWDQSGNLVSIVKYRHGERVE